MKVVLVSAPHPEALEETAMNEKEVFLREIREHPETHQHPDPDALLDCCLNGGDAPDLDILETHARYAPLCAPRNTWRLHMFPPTAFIN